jgi:hypothetical protein
MVAVLVATVEVGAWDSQSPIFLVLSAVLGIFLWGWFRFWGWVRVEVC